MKDRSGGVAVVVGTRPEAIKQAPVVRELRRRGCAVTLISTAQHGAVLDPLFEHFEVVPDVVLTATGPQRPSLSHLLARVTDGLGEVFEEIRPDSVVVQGDTTSAAAGALAGYCSKVPVVHLEAGLRTGHLDSPFPEEGNRRLISQVSALHLAPTQLAVDNLLREGHRPETIVLTGNTVIDALLFTAAAGRSRTGDRREVLVTAHRRESWGDQYDDILDGVARSSSQNPEVGFTWVAHPNQDLRRRVNRALGRRANVVIVDPLPYPQMVDALSRSSLVLTDSGGLQEEAPSLGIPVLVLRNTTERPEGVTAGCARLVGTNAGRIAEQVSLLLSDPAMYRQMSRAVNPYGDGTAASATVNAMELRGLVSPLASHSVALPAHQDL